MQTVQVVVIRAFSPEENERIGSSGEVYQVGRVLSVSYATAILLIGRGVAEFKSRTGEQLAATRVADSARVTRTR